jgi:N-acetylneuraminic acid mutarotase
MNRRTTSLLVMSAALAAGCLGATTESGAPIDIASPGNWAVLTPMPTPRQEVAVAALGGRVFVIGGLGAGAQPVATVEAYDPEANGWEVRAPLPIPLHHPAAAAVGDRLFVIGGFTGGRVQWTASQLIFEY